MAPIAAPNKTPSCTNLGSYSDIEKGLLATAQVGSGDKGGNGLLTAQGANNVISRLRAANYIPTAPDITNPHLNKKPWTAPQNADGNTKDPLAIYVSAQNELIANIDVEYNYVKGFYQKSLECLIDKVKEYAASNNATQRKTINTEIQTRLGYAREFNKKLNILLDIARKISEVLLSDSQSYNGAINKYNDEFGRRKTRLEEQANILNSESAASELHKRMVEYSAEKNRAHNNLLTLYSCLNIVAIAMLFYVAK